MVHFSLSTRNHRVIGTVLRILHESCPSAPTPGCVCTRMSLYLSVAKLAFMPKLQSCISSCYKMFLPVSLVPFRGQPVHFPSIALCFQVTWAPELTSSFTFWGPFWVHLHILGHLLSKVTHMSFPFHSLSYLTVFPAQCG